MLQCKDTVTLDENTVTGASVNGDPSVSPGGGYDNQQENGLFCGRWLTTMFPHAHESHLRELDREGDAWVLIQR